MRRLPILPLATTFTAILAVLVSCGPPAPLVVGFSPETDPLWEELLASHPLPEGFAHADAQSTPEEPAFRIVRLVGPLFDSAVERLQPDVPARRVLEADWLAPRVPLWDTMRPAPGRRRATPRQATIAREDLLPLAETGPPYSAIAAAGRYVDDPDYPFVEQTVLEFDPLATALEEDDEHLAALWGWFLDVPVTTAEPPRIGWIGGVGDLMVARGVTELLDRADGLEVVFSDVLPLMQGVDFLMGNLEGAVTTRGTPWEKTFVFRFHPRVLDPLHRAGFDYLSVVNNHSYDYGEVGFLDTLDHLEASPIATSGAGRNLEEASRPYRAVIPGGTQLRILSVGAYPLERSGFDGARETPAGPDRPGVLWADGRNPAAQRDAFAAMREAFGEETFNIVSVHGGPEWATAPSPAQRDLYRAFIDAGADLVLGHHSHVVQGLETYEGGLIAHSLGNFVFPGMFVTEYGEESVFLRIGVVDGAIRYVEPVPVRIDHQLLSLDTQEHLAERFSAATRALH